MLFTICRFVVVLVIFIATLTLANVRVSAQTPPEVNWIDGPTTVDLGDVAQIGLDEPYSFANGADLIKILKYSGEPTDGTEIGVVVPKDESLNWSVIFFFDAVGYVRDDEAVKLNNDSILDSIKKATDEANKTRTKNGLSGLEVKGWVEAPHYDPSSHNLTWAILAEDSLSHIQIVNFNTRLLGRGGYISVNLVTRADELASFKPDVFRIISQISWKAGNNYAEFKQGDKVAEIGLTALVAGTAGAVAAKTGILAKFWYLLVAGAIAIFSFFARIFRKIFHLKEKPAPYNDDGSGSIS